MLASRRLRCGPGNKTNRAADKFPARRQKSVTAASLIYLNSNALQFQALYRGPMQLIGNRHMAAALANLGPQIKV
jgi:hypothetical protein